MLIEKVKFTIERYNMLKRHDRVLVGLSGGPDSVTLLHMLLGLKEDYSLSIYIGHVDHMIRAKESADDKEFCEGLARRSGLEIFCESVDVRQIAKDRTISLEEAARLERYDFFKRVARSKGINKVAVGHTADDQAETVLMRLIRGSGATGLGGMSPVKVMNGLTIIRPLIEVPRREIENFIKEKNLFFRHDSSNDEIDFTRNRIRHELIPYLEDKFNPNVKEVLVNMAENLRCENEFLEKLARRKLKGIVKKNKSRDTILDIKKFKKQPEAIQKRICRAAIEQIRGNLRRLTYQHWREVKELVDNRPSNSIVDLPGGVNVVKNKDRIVFQAGP